MEYAMLKQIHEHSQQWTVKVRVTRISTHLDSQNPAKILRLNFVLLDEESGTMEAEIQEEWVPHFAPRIHEGSIYYIRYFRVVQARDTYRAVDRPIMARFTKYTNITEVVPCPPDFPKYACSLVPFQTLRDRDNDNTVCSDVLGIFTGCTHVKVQGTRGGPKKLRNVYLSDGSETVSVALWGNDAENFEAEEYMKMSNERPLVFLFVGLTSRLFRMSISLQGSLICKWFVEPDIPEAHTVRQTFIALNGSMNQPIWHGPALPAAEAEQTDVATLAAISNPHTIYDKRYVINVKIKFLKPNQQWWYHACSVCNKQSIPEGNTYRCSFRRCGSTRGGPRYRLPLIVIDPASSIQDSSAPSIELVLFGSKAEELLAIPVHRLIESQSEGQRYESVPTEKQFLASSSDYKNKTEPVQDVSPAPDSQAKENEPAKDISHDPGSQAKETSSTPQHDKCTPPPQPTPSSVKEKVYKRSRSEDVTGTSSDDDSSPMVSVSKEKSRAVKKLKFDAPAKEK